MYTDKDSDPNWSGPCDGCISGMCGHVHCNRCGCTWDYECAYGGWHNETQWDGVEGCYKDCPNSTCTWAVEGQD